jgi:hypothetical protein
MVEFFKWLSSTPTATTMMIIVVSVLSLSVIIVFLSAFFQGREISFWPPKIGIKPNNNKPELKTEKQQNEILNSENDKNNQTIKRIYDNYNKIILSNDDIFIKQADKILHNFENNIEFLANNQINLEKDDIVPFIINILPKVKSSIFATSFVKKVNFWSSSPASKVLDENYKAVKRGVKITRILIVEHLEEITHEVRQYITEHTENKIDIKIVFTNQLSSDLVYDMGIYDDKYVLYVDLMPKSKEMRNAKFHCNESEIRNAQDRQQRLLYEAHEVSEILKKLETENTK